MGYYYSLNHFDRYRAPLAGIKMWLYPVLAHGLYDTIAITILLGCFLRSLRRHRRAIILQIRLFRLNLQSLSAAHRPPILP